MLDTHRIQKLLTYIQKKTKKTPKTYKYAPVAIIQTIKYKMEHIRSLAPCLCLVVAFQDAASYISPVLNAAIDTNVIRILECGLV